MPDRNSPYAFEGHLSNIQLSDYFTHVFGKRGIAGLIHGFAQQLHRRALESQDPVLSAAALEAIDMLGKSSRLHADAIYALSNVAAALSDPKKAADPDVLTAYALMRDFMAHSRNDLPTDRRWDGAPKPETTLLVHCTDGMGFGDVLMYGVLCEEAKKQGRFSGVILEVPKNLMPIFTKFRFADMVVAKGDTLPPYDYSQPIMDLPNTLQLNTRRYKAPTAYMAPQYPVSSAARKLIQEEIWEKQKAGYRVLGIAWHGDPNNFPLEPKRSTHLANLEPLLKDPKNYFISLQRFHGSEHIGQLPPDLHAKIYVPSADIDPKGYSFYDSLHIMRQLTAVISTDTATAHAAGAVGTKTLIALPALPEQRYLSRLHGERTKQGAIKAKYPYYEDATTFIQSTDGDWGSVFQSIAVEVNTLNAYPKMHRAARPTALPRVS